MWLPIYPWPQSNGRQPSWYGTLSSEPPALAQGAKAVLVGIVSVLSGCSDADASSYCPPKTLSQSIYYGNREPDSVILTLDQRGALAALRRKEHDDLWCSAVLLTRKWAVTARHCHDVRLVLSGTVQNGPWSAEPIAAVPHPVGDLLLLELPEAEVPAAVTPLPFSVGDPPPVGDVVEMAGFGETETGGGGGLLFAPAEVVSVDERTITVKKVEKGGACFGDSGGPLLTATPAGPHVLGILSVGSAGCNGIDVYVRLDAVAAWVREYTAPSGNSCARDERGPGAEREVQRALEEDVTHALIEPPIPPA